jgi:DNA-binding response OmpR family regulator
MENEIMTYVVHLEDDGPLREILKVAFQATDPNVNLKQFISGDEVVAHIKPNIQLIDLFVLDIRVPGSIDGLGVARKIREFGSDAPIILTSAYRQPDRELVESLKLEWMSKPWHIMEIAQRLVKLARDQRAKAAKALVKPAATTATNTPAVSVPTAPAASSTVVNPTPANPSMANSGVKVNPPSVNPPAVSPPAPTAPVAATPSLNPSTVNPPAPKPPTTGKV